MTIWRLVVLPILVYLNGVPVSRERIFTVGDDQVTSIIRNDTGDYTITLTDDAENGVTYEREIVVSHHQVRLAYQKQQKAE